MSIPLDKTPYRVLVARLRDYEPWLSWLWLAASALSFVVVPALSLGGFIAGAYLAGDLHQPLRVLLGGVVALVVGQLVVRYIGRRRPWFRLIADRVWRYEDPPRQSDGTAWMLLPPEDAERARHVLRRAGLHADIGALLPAGGPPDAPALRYRLPASRADALRRPGEIGAEGIAVRALSRAGIRARINNHDVEVYGGVSLPPGTVGGTTYPARVASS